jgi:hypothetical protein
LYRLRKQQGSRYGNEGAISMPNGKLSGRAKPSRLMKKPASRKKRSKKFKRKQWMPKES